ncbi:MAG: DUF5723 family protein [bacterium]|nr:DUF5723 family protein [bacterium]
MACLALLLILPTTTPAQYNTNFLNYNLTGRSVSTSFEFAAGSTGITNEMGKKLMWGGYIDSKMKDESAELLKAKNNIGLCLNYDVNAFIKGGKSVDYLIGFSNQEILNSSFTKDFYELMFYGNAAFRGQTADLSNCSLNALRFQEFKFGAIMHSVDSIAKIGVSVSVLKGEQLFYIKTYDHSSLYTSIDGTELTLNSNFNMAVSDTNNKRFGGFNGLGASADIFFETPYVSRFGNKCLLTVNVNNLGFVHWWKESVQYSSDSTLTFKGYNVTNVNDLRDSALSHINSDSLLINLSNAHKEDFNVNIPTNLLMINKIYFNPQTSIALGFRHIFNANYRPYVFLEPEHRVKNMIFTFHVGYGGYVNLDVGAAITWNSKGWFVKLGSNSLQGYFLPKKAYAQGVFICLAKKLK